MLIYIKYKNNINTYNLDNELNISLIKDNDINILLEHNKITIKLEDHLYFKDYTNMKVINKNLVNIYYNETEIQIIIIKKLKYKFTKYKLLKETNIGKNLMNDIIIDRSYIDDLYGRINDDIIYNPYGVSINGNTLKEHKLVIGDVILIYDLIILYHKDFIMINNPNDVIINLEKIDINNECCLEQEQIINDIKFYNGFKELDIDIKLKDPMLLQVYNRSNLITSIGPIITLSFASLSLAMLNIYNKGLSTITEILPLVLFPIVMLLSALIWQPLNVFLSRKHIKKSNKERYIKYTNYLNDINKDIDNKIYKYKEIYNKSIKNIYELNYGYKDYIYIKNDYCNDYLYLYLGISNILSNIKISHNIREDDILYEPVINMCNKYKYINDSRLYIDLKKYKNIAINNNEIFIKMLLLQIMIYYNYNKLKIIVFIDDKDYEDISYLSYILNSKHNNELLLINNINSLNNIKSIINNDNDYICLIYDDKYINDINIKSRFNIYIYDTLNNFNKQIDALINVNEGIGTLNLFNELYEFKYNEVNVFIEKIGQYIKNNFYNNNITINHCFYTLHNIDPNNINNCYNENANEHLIAYLGYDKNNNPITLDLSDKAQGPHGLIAGTTGSGKSELISSMILSLAYQYTPQQVSFIIIDYKGSGLINNFVNKKYQLNHILKTISNLENDNIKRVLISIKNECIKRQKLFNELSNITNININSIYMYQSYYKQEYNLEVLGHLVIIIDEFAELKQQYNFFLQELVSVSRIGRSLGLHLVLSTQRPTGVVAGEIFSNSKFKICLKVNDDADSYEMLKVKDASSLKNPGEFILKVDDNITYGKTVLCNTSSKYYNYNNCVSILDYKQRQLYTNYKSLDKSSTQLEVVIQNINNYTNKVTSNIWHNPLVKTNYSTLINKYNYNEEHLILGEYDDLDNSKQGLITYNIKDNHNLVFISNNIESKKLFIDSISYYLLNNIDKNIIILDDDNNLYNKLLDYYPNRIILKTNDYNINYLLLKELKNSILIVNGSQLNNYLIEEYIYKNLENSKINNNNIFIIDSNIGTIKNKYLNYINYIIGININNIDTISQFDYKYKDYTFNESNGLIKVNNKVLYINLYESIYKDNYELIGKDIFNKIPDIIKPIYIRNKLLLGYNIKNLKGIYYKNNILIVTGYNKEYLLKYIEELKQLSCISYNKLEDNKILLVDKNKDLYSDNMIIVRIYDTSLINKYKDKNVSYLWLGKDIGNQVQIYSTNKFIDNNQGLYIDENKEELGYF